jgi:hypothetical protein
VYKNAAKYLAGLFKVATVITNPAIETNRAGMMCSDRDLILSEFHAQAQETRAARQLTDLVTNLGSVRDANRSNRRTYPTVNNATAVL